MYAQYYLLTFDKMHLLNDVVLLFDDPDLSLAEVAFETWQNISKQNSRLDTAEFTVFDKVCGAMTIDTWTKHDAEVGVTFDEEVFV